MYHAIYGQEGKDFLRAKVKIHSDKELVGKTVFVVSQETPKPDSIFYFVNCVYIGEFCAESFTTDVSGLEFLTAEM